MPLAESEIPTVAWCYIDTLQLVDAFVRTEGALQGLDVLKGDRLALVVMTLPFRLAAANAPENNNMQRAVFEAGLAVSGIEPDVELITPTTMTWRRVSEAHENYFLLRVTCIDEQNWMFDQADRLCPHTVVVKSASTTVDKAMHDFFGWSGGMLCDVFCSTGLHVAWAVVSSSGNDAHVVSDVLCSTGVFDERPRIGVLRIVGSVLCSTA